MGKVVILTDSSSGIRQAEAQQLGISVLPMPFFINGETLFEDINLTQDTFYEHLTDGAEISTSMPAVGPHRPLGLFGNEYDEIKTFLYPVD